MQVRLLNNPYQADLKELMKSLGVDPAGIRIMAPKGIVRVIYIRGIPSFTANILKQEMLSLGGEVALPKEALFKKKKVACILTATDWQLKKLFKKLKTQPYSLNKAGELIKETLKNFSKEKFCLNLPKKRLNINKPLVMGIINVTPDSFSGDGLVREHQDIDKLISERLGLMVSEGVDIIDVGGESTRPGAKKVSLKEELKRVIPVIKLIKKEYPKIPVSVDTSKPQVAEKAIKVGASIVNDITALKSKPMAELVSKKKVGVVLMHMKGIPANMQNKPYYKDVLTEIYDFLEKRVKRAVDFGISKNKIIVDVGIGFGKRLEDNLKLVKHLYQFKSLGFPILIGVSRKSFIGKVLKETEPSGRVVGTVTSNALSILNGANILRVHDVKEAKQAVRLSKEIMSS